MKNFIGTVDTEGDNLWAWRPGEEITVENTKYIPRFQGLCEKYGFCPVYLTNNEMIESDEFCAFLKQKASEKKCEVGMHLHAWNTPPEYNLEKIYSGLPYITEYPEEIIYEKHLYLKCKIEDKTGISPVSYRAGRWATNAQLFHVLERLGFTVDCSVTPGISWNNCEGLSIASGSDYRTTVRNKPYRVSSNLIEIPLTSKKLRTFYGSSMRQRIKNSVIGVNGFLRPAVASLEIMKRTALCVGKLGSDYLEFMIHSSELMPGGSPYFRNEEEIENMYRTMESFFAWVSKNYKGISLSDYAEILKKEGL